MGYTHQALLVGDGWVTGLGTFFLQGGSICTRETFYLPVQVESHSIRRAINLSLC